MPIQGRIGKKFTELTGLYAVATQMSLLCWHPFPTIGNFPDIDLIAYNLETNKRVALQIKSGYGAWGIGTANRVDSEWVVSGIKKADAYVFVDTRKEQLSEILFYVVPTESLIKIVKKHASLKFANKGTDKPQPYWINSVAESHRDEWKEVKEFKDRWDLLS